MDPVSAGRAPVPLLIVFLDLSRFSAQTRRVDDAALAEVVDAFYERVAAAVTGAGGRVVKFMGDAALAVFPAERTDDGVGMLLGLKGEVDDWMASLGWECRLAVRAHVGTVMAGAYGGAGDKRFDVIGSEVNTAAMLEGSGVSLSVAAFRQLGRALRTRFKKHTAPVTYIRVEDSRKGWRRAVVVDPDPLPRPFVVEEENPGPLRYATFAIQTGRETAGRVGPPASRTRTTRHRFSRGSPFAGSFPQECSRWGNATSAAPVRCEHCSWDPCC